MATTCKPFSVTIKGEPAAVLEEIKKAGKGKIEIKGNEKKGSIKVVKHKVTGTYKVTGQKITFELVEDEWYLSCSRVEDEIAKYFKGK
ncbi:MAG: hypothetical protein AAGK04_00975 [Planctomycetota bacterium]